MHIFTDLGTDTQHRETYPPPPPPLHSLIECFVHSLTNWAATEEREAGGGRRRRRETQTVGDRKIPKKIEAGPSGQRRREDEKERG